MRANELNRQGHGMLSEMMFNIKGSKDLVSGFSHRHDELHVNN